MIWSEIFSQKYVIIRKIHFRLRGDTNLGEAIMKKGFVTLLIGASVLMLVACKRESGTAVTDEIPEALKTPIMEAIPEEMAEEIAKDTDLSDALGLGNPWVETDKEGVLEATGFPVDAPAEASNIVYSYMNIEPMIAQVSYDLDGASWVYRMQMANELTDISGMNYEWISQNVGEVSGREAMYYGYSDMSEDADTIDGINCVQVVDWYDVVPGVVYSLSASGQDLNGMDIQVYAEAVFEPLQGEVAGDEDEPDTAENQGFLGVHTRSEDESDISIEERPDGTLKVDISIIRLCFLEDGTGVYEDYKIPFSVMDPSRNELKGVIYKDSDGESLAIRITDSTWEYLPNGEILAGFGK